MAKKGGFKKNGAILKQKKDDIEKYKFIFEHLYKEYEELVKNSRSIDTKAGVFLTILFATLPFYIQTLGVDFIKEACDFNHASISKSFFLFFFIMSLAFYVISFCFYILCLFPRDFKYMSVNSNDFSDSFCLEKKIPKLNFVDEYKGNIKAISSCVSFNYERSIVKAKRFKRALKSFMGYSALILLVILLKLFLIF